MPTSQAAHARRVLLAARSGAREAAQAPQQDWVMRSWRRCLDEHQLDPFDAFSPSVESAGHVRRSRERLGDCLQAARGGMEQLFKHVADLGYVLMLTDAEGITIDFIGNDAWCLEARRRGLCIGANWQEGHAGTNGIGSTLQEGRALTCHLDEHFYAGNIGLSCSTARLFHPEGELMGVLDVSTLATADARASQHLALHLTKLYAKRIDDANFMRHFRHHWMLRLASNRALVGVQGDMLLAFEADGRLVGANGSARRRLAVSPAIAGDASGAACGVSGHVTELFDCTMDDIWQLARTANATDRPLVSRTGQHIYCGSVVAPHQRAAASGVRQLADARNKARAPQPLAPPLARLSGDDGHMRALQHQAQRLADKGISILIQGETGSGKEVFAKAIHQASKRRDKPFVAVNCAAIPESLIESELFGYTAGTFTGARSRGMKGLILQADGGTLFLDEIGDMPLHLQPRLLRVLSESEVLPLGAERPTRITLSVIAASHRELRQQIAAGGFREDLYYRLCGATLMVPSLRDRSDLDYLIDLLLRETAEAAEPPQQRCGIDPAARALLLNYPWPGNVRQLRNALRFAVALSDGDGIFPEHLPPEVRAGAPVNAREAAPPLDAAASPRRMTAQILRGMLQSHQWNISAVAAETGLARTTIYRQMKRLGIVAPLRTHAPKRRR